MSASTFTVSTSTATCWNGPICPTCSARYLGSHVCSWDDLQRRIEALRTAQDHLTRAVVRVRPDRSATCPCRPENGGSGICGCINGGPTVTY